MKKIIFFNPAISTLNKGDDIIAEACKKYLNEVIPDDAFIIDICSHLPVLNIYLKYAGETQMCFVLGSNLLDGKMNSIFKQWHIWPHNLKRLNNIVLMGVGWRKYEKRINHFTKRFYTKMFSGSFIHSVRDEYTKQMLNRIGINNVINTGCPTMWMLTKEHCNQIPIKKSEAVVFTLTDYNQNRERDSYLIDILKKNYNKIYFWLQGIGDDEYIKSLTDCKDIIKIGPSLQQYNDFLINTECDYVGTRLHAGIKAMQCFKRSIIIGIDNRAIELKRDYGINCVEEKDIDQLDKIINSDIHTIINLNEEGIKSWLSQFDI